MGTAIKHRVPDQAKLSFVIFDIWALWVPGFLTWSGTGWCYMATVSVKRLISK